MVHHVIGVFKTNAGVANAVEALVQAGIDRDRISVLMTDRTRAEHFALEESNKAAAGAAAGGVLGGLIGALLLGLTSVAAVAVPGVGLLAAGPIVAAFAGGGAGATTGGLVGGLVGLGVKQIEAKLYAEEVHKGGVLLGVHAMDRDQARSIRSVLAEMGALNIKE